MNDIDNILEKKLESRRATRTNVFNIIFQIEFYGSDNINEILENYYEMLEYEEYLEKKENQNFLPYKINKKKIEEQVFSLIENIEKIDNIIKEKSIGWKIERLDKVDLAIIRLAIFEIIFDASVPNKVAINEAIEISKEYSTQKAYKFINGILSNIEK